MSLQGKRVACIDDDPSIITLVERIIENADGIFRGGTDFEDTKEILDNFCPHILLMDISLFQDSGINIIKSPIIKQKAVNTKIIMLSATKDIEHVKESVRSGASDFIIKPFNTKDLLKKINNSLKNLKIGLQNLTDLELETMAKCTITEIGEDRLILNTPFKLPKGVKVQIDAPNLSFLMKSNLKYISSGKGNMLEKGHFKNEIFISGATSEDIKKILEVKRASRG